MYHRRWSGGKPRAHCWHQCYICYISFLTMTVIQTLSFFIGSPIYNESPATKQWYVKGHYMTPCDNHTKKNECHYGDVLYVCQSTLAEFIAAPLFILQL